MTGEKSLTDEIRDLQAQVNFHAYQSVKRYEMLAGYIVITLGLISIIAWKLKTSGVLNG